MRVLLLACVRGGGRVLHRVAAAGVRRGEAQPLLGAAQRSSDLGSAVRLQLPQLVLQELDLHPQVRTRNLRSIVFAFPTRIVEPSQTACCAGCT